MSKSIKKFNGLNGSVTAGTLKKIGVLAQQEGQAMLLNRINKALDLAGASSKYELVVKGKAIEQVPSDLLPQIEPMPSYISNEEFTGLNKSVQPSDIYDMITQKMIELIKKASGHGYKKKWNAQQVEEGYMIPFNFASKKQYRGINIGLLTEFMTETLENPFFLTFNQIKENKGKLIKGSKGFPVVYFTKLYNIDQHKPKLNFSTYDIKKFISFVRANSSKIIDYYKTDTPETYAKRRYIPILKYYNVFNGKDITGIDFDLDNFKRGYVSAKELKVNDDPRVELADLIIENYPKPIPPLRHRGSEAFYRPAGDYVQMPRYETFETGLDYYRTLLHEYIHSTGHHSRLARDFSGRFGSKKYAREELVAEFGAVFLSAHAGIIWRTQRNHAEYLKNWSRALGIIKEDNTFLMRAASKAQAATDFVLNLDKDGNPAFAKALKSKTTTKKKETPVPTKKKVLTNTRKKKDAVPKPKTPARTPKKKDAISKKYDFVYRKGADDKYIIKSYHNWSETRSLKWLDIDINSGVEIYKSSLAGLKSLLKKYPNSSKAYKDAIAITDLKVIDTSKTLLRDRKEMPKKTIQDPTPKKVGTRATKNSRSRTRKKIGTSEKVDAQGQYALLGEVPTGQNTFETQKGDNTTTLPGGSDRPGVSKFMKATDIIQKDFEVIELPGDWGQVMENPAKNMKISITGMPKNGKTVGACQFAAVLADKGTVLYNFCDQGVNASTKEILRISGLAEKENAFFTTTNTTSELESDIKELNPDFVFIDMINNYIDNDGLKPHEFRERFIKQFPNTSFILVFGATKSGRFKGDQDWEHVVDELVHVENYMMSFNGRYGSGERIIWNEGAKRRDPSRYDDIINQYSSAVPSETKVQPGANNMAFAFEES